MSHTVITDTREDIEETEAENHWLATHIVNKERAPAVKTVQKNWDKPCSLNLPSEIIKSRCNPSDRLRMLAIAQNRAPDWLLAAPIPSLGLKLDYISFRIACRL